MEIRRVLQVASFSRINVVFESPELVFDKLLPGNGLETFFRRDLLAVFKLLVDGVTSDLCERLAVQVFGFDLRNKAGVARNMLGFDVVSRASQPVFTNLRVVSVLDLLTRLIHRWSHGVQVTLRKRSWLGNNSVDIVVAGLLSLAHDDLVNVSSCAAVDFVFERHMSSVTWQELLLVVDRHSNKTNDYRLPLHAL